MPMVQRVSPKSDLKDRFLKALTDKVMKMAHQRIEQMEKQKKLEDLQSRVTAVKSDSRGPEKNFTYPFELMVEDKVKYDCDETRVRISIWKLDPVYEALMINS